MSVSSPAPAGKKPLLSDSTYTRLKKTATIVLPALAALYIALAQIWHFPKVEEVAGSIAALNTFLGVLIQISKKSYYASGLQYAGVINVMDDGDKKTYQLVTHGDPEELLDSASEATFQVKNTDTGENPIINP